jgi:hypothetical protein
LLLVVAQQIRVWLAVLEQVGYELHGLEGLVVDRHLNQKQRCERVVHTQLQLGLVGLVKQHLQQTSREKLQQ